MRRCRTTVLRYLSRHEVALGFALAFIVMMVVNMYAGGR